MRSRYLGGVMMLTAIGSFSSCGVIIEYDELEFVSPTVANIQKSLDQVNSDDWGELILVCARTGETVHLNETPITISAGRLCEGFVSPNRAAHNDSCVEVSKIQSITVQKRTWTVGTIPSFLQCVVNFPDE